MATDKKTEAPLSVEERLKTLYRLQLIQSEIHHIRNVRGDLPKEVEDLEYTIGGLHTRMERYTAEIEDLNIKKVAEKNKIENKRSLIARYKEQQNNIRNSLEYDNLQKEIEFETLQIRLGEKNIDDIEKIIDRRSQEIAAIENEIADHTHLLEQKKADLETIIGETRVQEEALIEKAKALEPLIDERTLSAFKRICKKNARNGLGIVTVDRSACGGCFNRIPPQKQIDIRSHKKLIVCEYCGRILIDPELAQEAAEENK